MAICRAARYNAVRSVARCGWTCQLAVAYQAFVSDTRLPLVSLPGPAGALEAIRDGHRGEGHGADGAEDVPGRLPRGLQEGPGSEL